MAPYPLSLIAQSFEQLRLPRATDGFLLYPNKSNTNMMQSIYGK